MKVYSLQCEQGHAFEGWFASEGAYAEQCDRGLLECPLCASKAVQRLPSAPRLSLSGARADVGGSAVAATPEQQSVEALWMRAIRHVMKNTEDVGERFADEARRIHYGEAAERGIRGRASSEEAQALQDEGIEICELPALPALKGPLQ